MRFVFRNFPLASIHPHAQQAAEASEAAGAQGLFWEMHDRLFEKQRALNLLHLLEYAREIGANRRRFLNDLESHAYFQHVRADFSAAYEVASTAHPHFSSTGSATTALGTLTRSWSGLKLSYCTSAELLRASQQYWGLPCKETDSRLFTRVGGFLFRMSALGREVAPSGGHPPLRQITAVASPRNQSQPTTLEFALRACAAACMAPTFRDYLNNLSLGGSLAFRNPRQH